MADIKPVTNEANTLTSLIPDFFYVLIARIIPGFLFIIGLVYALDKTIIFELLLNVSITLKNPDTVLKFNPPYTLIFILLLILSYASGLILSFLGDLLGRKCYICQYRKMLGDFPAIHKWLRGLAELKKESPKKDKGCDILFQRQHDYVKQEYAHQARSLSQAEAEGQLCIITSAAYIVLFLIQTIKLIIEKEFLQRWDSLIIFLVIAIISFIAALYRNKRFLMRQFSYSAEIKKKEEKTEKPKNKNEDVQNFKSVIIIGINKFKPPTASS